MNTLSARVKRTAVETAATSAEILLNESKNLNAMKIPAASTAHFSKTRSVFFAPLFFAHAMNFQATHKATKMSTAAEYARGAFFANAHNGKTTAKLTARHAPKKSAAFRNETNLDFPFKFIFARYDCEILRFRNGLCRADSGAGSAVDAGSRIDYAL